jgi:ABC-type polysaccharide transport system permease subunit
MLGCGQHFLQYQRNEQSQRNTQHISVSAITFSVYTQSQKIVNQIIKILGINKIKMSSQGNQTWLRSLISSQGILYVGRE